MESYVNKNTLVISFINFQTPQNLRSIIPCSPRQARLRAASAARTPACPTRSSPPVPTPWALAAPHHPPSFPAAITAKPPAAYTPTRAPSTTTSSPTPCNHQQRGAPPALPTWRNPWRKRSSGSRVLCRGTWCRQRLARILLLVPARCSGMHCSIELNCTDCHYRELEGVFSKNKSQVHRLWRLIS